MITDKAFKKGMISFLIILLLGLSFLILKPIIMSIIIGLLLAYVFYPVYKLIYKILNFKSASALLICLFAILIFLIPVWFMTPVLVGQVFDIYTKAQGANIIGSIKSAFPSLFPNEQISAEAVAIVNSMTANFASSLLEGVVGVLTNLPIILFHFTIVLFVFFFVLRDGDKLKEFTRSLSPFTIETEKKFLDQFKGITDSVIYGQIIVGIVGGILTGIGLFIFGVPNLVFLTVLAMLVGIFPIIGPWLIWFPVAIFLLISGNSFEGIGLLIYGFFVVSGIDTIIRPYIVSKRVKVHSAIVLIGMIGGGFVFGILGLILGPLILSYFLLFLEFYQKRKFASIFSEE